MFKKVVQQDTKEARVVLEEATIQAARIIKEAHLFNRKAEADLKKALAEATRQIIEDTKKEMRSLLGEVSTTAAKELEQVRHFSHNQVAELNHKLEQEYQDSRDRLEQEIRATKRRKLKSLQAKLNKSLPQIIKDAAGRSVSLAEHEKAVLDAINEAQDEGVWI